MAPLVTSPADSDASGALERASRELRAAVITADHTRAERAVTRFTEALQEHWGSLPEHERAVSGVATRTRELLAWTREMTLIQRNLAADQFAALQKASRYHGAVSSHRGLDVKG